MCIEYNECHYGGMYNVYVKRIFVITKIVHMNEKTGTGVSSEKEKVKESQSRSVTPSIDTPSGVGWGHHKKIAYENNLVDPYTKALKTKVFDSQSYNIGFRCTL